jgi:hypothetical protein
MKKFLVTLALTIALVGCGGGGNGGYGPGGGGLDHNDLAVAFVNAMNFDGYDVDLAKSETIQFGYIVVYDYDFGTYDAYDIYGWQPGVDPSSFIAGTSFYGDLLFDPFSNIYTDFFTGIQFEKSEESVKDVSLLAELAEEAVVSENAKFISEKFGLSVERSKDIVRIGHAWQKQGGKDMTTKDQDAFAKEMLGFTITEALDAVQKKNEGSLDALEDLIGKAAETNETTPEHVKTLISEFIGE